jgi:putative ABC transport system permease protein
MNPGAREPRPPRLGEKFLEWTLPVDVSGESIKGDLDQEYRQLRDASLGRSFRGWYLWEAMKLGVRIGVLRFLRVRSPFVRGSGKRPRMGAGERILQEFGHGTRFVVRSPGLALFAVAAMGLGIGATATMFSTSHGLLRDLPYVEPDRLVYVGWERIGEPNDDVELTVSELAEWRESQSTLEALAAARVQTMDLAGTEGPPERISGAQVTADAFEAVRVQPTWGRSFLPEEEVVGGPDVVLLSHGLWTRRYGADPQLLGRTIRVNGTERTVVGIMPEGFRFPEVEDVWIPLQVDAAGEEPGEGVRRFRAFGRLREGVALEEARAEFETLARRFEQANPEAYQGYASRLIRYYEYFVGLDAIIIMNTLLLIASFVLLIACASVANLFLARAAGRSRDLAVRSAMGASRGRIIGQLLSETMVISVMGGVLGAGIAYVGGALVQRSLAAQLPFYWMDTRADGTVLVFVGLLVLLAGVLAGIFPALKVSGIGVSEVLKDGDRASSFLRLGRLSRMLVVAEVTLSFGLLATAGMMGKGPLLWNQSNPGFDSSRMFSGEVSLRPEQYPGAEDWTRFYQELLPRLETVPGVRAATLSSSLPGLQASTWRFHERGVVYDRTVDLPLTRVSTVAPHFFRTLDVEAVEGRLFDDGDNADGDPVVIINRSFADRFFPDESPLGLQILPRGQMFPRDLDDQGTWVTVVGVVPDLRMNGPRQERPEGIYLPLPQRPQSYMNILLQSSADPEDLIPLVRASVAGLDPDLPLNLPRTLQVSLAEEMRAEVVLVSLLAVSGSIALLLASVGLFGVLAFAVRRRTREIGIRMALGAEVRSVLWQTLQSGLTQVTMGLVGGALLALTLSSLVRDLFFAEKMMDWGVYGVVSALMLGTGIAASLIPAARATRVNPVEALRQD